MIKRLIALAFALAFGIAHAADDTAGVDKKSGPDAAIGNTPQTTAPAGTNANQKASKHTTKHSKKKTRRHHTKENTSGMNQSGDMSSH